MVCHFNWTTNVCMDELCFIAVCLYVCLCLYVCMCLRCICVCKCVCLCFLCVCVYCIHFNGSIPDCVISNAYIHASLLLLRQCVGSDCEEIEVHFTFCFSLSQTRPVFQFCTKRFSINYKDKKNKKKRRKVNFSTKKQTEIWNFLENLNISLTPEKVIIV
jgi:hypothetical protein